MSILDELREQMARQVHAAEDRGNMVWADGASAMVKFVDAFEANACDGCRHWGGEPDSAKLGACHVAGSFRAPGGLFTEGDFCCCHWTKP